MQRVRPVDEHDHDLLVRAVALARDALDQGHEPFGTLLVDRRGTVLVEDHNRVGGGDATQHPELAVARWAAAHLEPAERARATVYTSGEHCPMCSAAHAWVGVGRIVYAASTAQLGRWRAEWGVDAGPVAPLPIGAVAPDLEVSGPDPALTEEVRALHARSLGVH